MRALLKRHPLWLIAGVTHIHWIHHFAERHRRTARHLLESTALVSDFDHDD
jgi:hypothetical protein